MSGKGASKRGVEAVKALAAAGAMTDAAPPKDLVPFNFDKESLIIDFKSLLQLPFDTEQDGVKALRAIVFNRGTGSLYPKDPAKLLIMGKFRRQNAFSLVHFDPRSVRAPELLINFVDYGMVNSARTGVSVETLALPLMKAKKVYNSDVNVTPIKEVVGFEPIDCGVTPWSTTLKPCLDQIAQFKRTAVCNTKSMQSYIGSSMALKLDDCKRWALEDIDEEVKAISRQDESQGSKQRAIFVSKLDALFAEISKWPLKNFDPSLDKRIVCIDPEDKRAAKPEWLSSSVLRQMVTKNYLFVPRRLLLPRCRNVLSCVRFFQCFIRIQPHAPQHVDSCCSLPRRGAALDWGCMSLTVCALAGNWICSIRRKEPPGHHRSHHQCSPSNPPSRSRCSPSSSSRRRRRKRKLKRKPAGRTSHRKRLHRVPEKPLSVSKTSPQARRSKSRRK